MNEADPQNNIFLVEKLLDRRWRRQRSEYLVKWMGYPDSENSWEPKQNINPVLVEQFDAEKGGPLTGPAPKAPKPPKTPRVTKAAARPSETATPPQRGRPRGPPKQREEIPTTSSTRGRRRKAADTTSETNTSTGSVDDESINSSAAETTKAEPAKKKARVEEKPKNKVEEKAEDVEIPEIDQPEETADKQEAETKSEAPVVVTEVHIETITEITQEEATFSNAPSVPVSEPEIQFVDEVKIPTIDLAEESPLSAEEKQPEVVYEYEQAEVETVSTDQGSSTLITEHRQVEVPVDEPDSTSVQQEERFESVSYVVEDDDEPQIIQIHETSTTVTSNNGALPTEQAGKGENTESKQSENFEATVRETFE
ncbi:Chromobox protein-like protein 3-like protein [Aphelenchoides bicaudatus]|nr:Chromobox protein-like protein 3-like protein [Aphelenchoides bicaudatus]